MSKPKELLDCKTHDDFVRYARAKGATIREGGSHTIVKGPTGIAPVPRHKGDLPVGTRKNIVRLMLAAGLGVLILAILLPLLRVL